MWITDAPKESVQVGAEDIICREKKTLSVFEAGFEVA